MADSTGAVVPGATITIVDKETNQTQTGKTDGGGAYTFNRLAPAQYTVTVEAQGFNKKTVDNVGISGEIMQGLNISLDAEGSNQSITVTDTAPPINTSTATISGVISAQQLQALPSSNRDPYQLLRLSPGALGDGSQAAGGGSFSLPGNGGIGGSTSAGSIFAVENRAQTQANGVRTSGNSFQIDGSQVNSLAWGGGAVITPNQESVKEVQTQTSPYDATQGRNSGAQVLVVSKNGTNDFHGSAFIKLHRPGLNAYQRYNGPGVTVQRDNNQFNQLGGSIGGPIWKNHIFFFFSYEELRNSGKTQDIHWYETPAYDQLVAQTKQGGVTAAIAGYTGQSVNYASIDATSNCAYAGFTPSNCHDVSYNGGNALDLGSPLKTPLGTADPSWTGTASPGTGGGFDGVADLFRVNTLNPTRNTNQQFNGRLDWQLNPRDLIAYTIYWVPTSQTSFNGPNRTSNLWNVNRLAYSHAALWNHIFSPTLLNEFRLNGVRWYFNEVTSNPQEPFGLPQATLDPMAGITDFQYLGAPGPGNFAQTTYNLRDTLTKTWRSHNIRFGFDGYRELDNDTQSSSAIPVYTFRNLWEMANDKPRLENGAFDPRTGAPTTSTKYIRSYIYAGYVQDDWRVTPKLTLNLGMRWEYFTPITEKNGNISNLVLGTGAQTLTNASVKVGGDLFKTSKNNWGPQVGFAYSINPSSTHLAVIRGGFGIAYNRMQEAITLNGRANPPLVTNLSAACTNTTLTNCPGIYYAASSSPTNISGYPVNPAAQVTFGANGLPTSGAQIALYGIQQDLPTPMTYKLSLGVEYALSQKWVLSVGYQGSLSRHYTRTNQLNWIYYPNLNPAANSVTYYSNDVTASSHALLTEVRRSMGKQFSITAQYRYGKIMDSGSQDYYIDQYPYNTRYAYGPADYNVTHNAKLFGTWSPNFFPHNKLMEGIFGGFQLSGIIQYHTGFPWTPIYNNTGCNVVYVGSGYCNLRPGAQIARGSGGTSNSTFERAGGQFPNGGLAYFTVPTYPTTGMPPPPGVGRNSLPGPRYFDTDMDAQKTFGLPHAGFLGENAGLTIRAMFFNLFNQTNIQPFNLGDTNTLITSPNFGQAYRGLGSRTIEFQARFSF
ncbi:MAG: TonB-dependent receptor [Edaphobacter sp.]|uniref:TonB-dependent receptor n=1 Tax=Edaphobacter sp. TaxID=1934404 RepID=UPI00239DA5EB|nr:carboxypeptidase regulatory-like domain-containing protein [Edaphobacter sp.]MDE1176440.1 TonB-dependent receptor [Edaphobacter sp.]